MRALRAVILLALAACGARTPLDTPESASDAGAGALRPLAPLSTSTVTTQRPTFHWTGAIAARLEVCADRACANVEATVDASDTSTTLAADLAPGVHFWRLHPIAHGVVQSATSAVWEFRVPHRSSPRDTSWGVFPDFDGDGHADLIEASQLLSFTLSIFPGSPAGVQTDHRIDVTPFDHDLVGAVDAVGDLDGDGFGDLAVARAPDPSGVVVYRGGPNGIDPKKPSWILAPPGGDDGLVFGEEVASAGDLNGDGYADMLVSEDAELDVGGPPGRFLIYFGGPSGPSSSPAIILHPTDPSQLSAAGIAEAGDVDGDGFPDVVALTQHALETGAPGVYLYRGGPDGPSDATRVLLASLPIDPDCFTPPLSSAPGDLDGDGYADVVVGLTDCLTDEIPGRDLVVFGGPSPRTIVLGEPPGFDGSGNAVHIAWDVDGDGFDDLVAGASTGPVESGGIVYWGSPSGPSDAARTTFGLSTIAGDPNGFAVTSSDLDGDGLEDVAIASLTTGRVTIFSGGPSGLAAKATIAPPQTGADYEPYLR